MRSWACAFSRIRLRHVYSSRLIYIHYAQLNDDDLLVTALSTALKPGTFISACQATVPLTSLRWPPTSLGWSPRRRRRILQLSPPRARLDPIPLVHPASKQTRDKSHSIPSTNVHRFVRWSTEVGSRMPSRPLEQQHVTLKDILDASGAYC